MNKRQYKKYLKKNKRKSYFNAMMENIVKTLIEILNG